MQYAYRKEGEEHTYMHEAHMPALSSEEDT